MAELTGAMIEALRLLDNSKSHQKPMGVAFSTMTALVRRGLVERDSCKIIERRYSSSHGYDQLQVKDRKGWWIHEYWITPEGFGELERHG